MHVGQVRPGPQGTAARHSRYYESWSTAGEPEREGSKTNRNPSGMEGGDLLLSDGCLPALPYQIPKWRTRFMADSPAVKGNLLIAAGAVAQMAKVAVNNSVPLAVRLTKSGA